MRCFTATDGVQLHYTDWGQGRPVVLLHGWPLSLTSWDYHAIRLVEHGYRVIRYDRRGFGRSEQPWNGYDYDTLAADLGALLRHLALDDAVLVGFSMAAGEVVRYLARYGNAAVSAAVLIAGVTPMLAQSPTNPQGIPAADFAGFEQALSDAPGPTLSAYAHSQFSDSSWREDYLAMARQASARAIAATARAWYATDFHADLATISVPILILHGGADQSAPAALTGRKTHALIPASRYVEYPAIGHYLPLEAKERLTEDLLVFLEATSRR
ncbi:alpha/beta hydrolase [Bordetella trematum]|uniref:alpha/beta fold hydrolase n=1 Tax=Bordetella trematum TaxID=123899 RepID=UPI000C770B7D|nr:alpha/beta hydrolase [Bordetella trematum]AUL46478.1 alpha/beta hydrolase [Bordetella trematum]